MNYPLIIIVASILVLFLAYVIHLTVVYRRKHHTSHVKKDKEREEKIEQLSISMEQFKKIYEEAPVPYFILNRNGEIQDVNKAGLRFFGVLPEDIVKKNLFSFISEEDADDKSYIMTCCERNVPINQREVRIVSKNNEMRWIQLSILGIADPENKSPSSLATIFDITEQKNLDRAKTEFVSLASHQLRTPLATIKWYTDMLSNPAIGDLNAKQHDYMTILKEVNATMVELVDTLLNVSRMEIGKLSVALTPIDVQKVVESIIMELSSQIQKKNMNIVKSYDGLFTNVTSDPNLLRIIIHNLITNAIKYTPDGGTITIHFEMLENRNAIVVSDTGFGIPQSQQDKIFTKLFRADNVKEISSSQSSGLGLYLVKSLVEALGGAISFQSEENKGTSFTVTF